MSYLFVVSMDVDAEHEALFNEVYDTEHVPMLLEVPGVIGVRRYRREPFHMVMGGERRAMDAPGEPLYTAIYEIESPAVLTSEEWAAAVDRGRWPSEVRPYTRNRRHVLLGGCRT